MAMIVRSEHDLPTLRVSLGRGERGAVELSVMRGRVEIGSPTGCQTVELGPTTSMPQGAVPDEAFTVPDHVMSWLAGAFERMGPSPIPPERAVWLEFPSPRGYLHLLPWERLLAPLGRPVLRLPNHTVRPQAPSAIIEVALLASSPLAKSGFDPAAQVDRLARLWRDRSGHDVHLHLFTDAAAYPRLRDLTADLGPRLHVYDPAQAERRRRRERSDPGDRSSVVSNPWLTWVTDALTGHALDVVHVVAHGYLSGDRGALALASSPEANTDRSWARFVGAAELSTFLTGIGAWSLVVSGPPDNSSGMGLRELGDAIALNSPGVTATHELTLDPEADQLGHLIEMVYAGGGADLEPMPAVTCWVHPKFVEYPPEEQESLLLTSDGRSALVQGATQELLSADHTPSWVASGTRYLESLQTRWLPESPSEPVDQDAVKALESVSDLLEHHAQRHLGHGASS